MDCAAGAAVAQGEIAGRGTARWRQHDRPNVARVDSARGLGRVPGLHRAHRRARVRGETPGNSGFYILRREDGDRIEFVTMSSTAGRDPRIRSDNLEVVFYDEDDRFLVDRERFVTHYEIVGP